ncbi:MAG: Na+/H+ antiporter subunit G [Candidatus Omnitrophota bacterium]|nr:MAG: Na+/H+ antiporter subunit G [Candidatus Omnitrophota bacterium]
MMRELLSMVFIGIGLGFDLLGCLGLVRFPDVYNRLQAATKCVTFGTCSILFGTFLILGFTSAGIKCLLALVFIVLTSPTASHALARASHKAGVRLWERSVCDEYSNSSK